ncbi:MAG: transketolase [Deltaproteobacteria bacterium]
MKRAARVDAEVKRLEGIARKLRRRVLDMIFKAQAGHVGGSFSSAEMLACLYFRVMKIDTARPDWPDRDRLLISKGHCCPIYYAALAERGYFPVKALDTYDECDSILEGHPDIRTPGVDMSSGSLGLGLSAGVGLALGARQLKKDFHTYVLIGDGECQSGNIWEAAMSAAKYGLGNLTAIVDKNLLQVTGFLKDVMPIDPLKEKWEAFNWRAIEIDGNNIKEVLDALTQCRKDPDRPSVIIAKTVKGKGVSFMENSPNWHAKIISRDEYDRAIMELDNV